MELLKFFTEPPKYDKNFMQKSIIISSLPYYLVAYLYFPSLHSLDFQRTVFLTLGGTIVINLILYFLTRSITDNNPKFAYGFITFTNIFISMIFIYFGILANFSLYIFYFSMTFIALMLATLPILTRTKKE